MHLYAIALGSNRRHGRHGSPRRVIVAALAALAADMRITATSPIVATPALGPAGRAFANAAAIVASPLEPPALLALLKRHERAFGRRGSRRWGARVLDLDMLLWSGGVWRSTRPALRIPHPALAERRFVLDPLRAIAPRWRVPPEGRSIAQIAARLTRRASLHRAATGSGP